jgi:ATP-binding cassette subfamily B protein
MPFPHYQQRDIADCGPACLKMISQFYGKNFDIDFFRDNCYLGRDGVSMLAIAKAAEQVGFKTLSVKLSLDRLIKDAPLPCILHWEQNHFVVLEKVKSRSLLRRQAKFYIADPSVDRIVHIDEESFLNSWVIEGDNKGITLIVQPTEAFFNQKIDTEKRTQGFKVLLPYIKPFKRYIIQLLFGMVFGAVISLIFPFLTQALVDYGIQRSNPGFITTILLSQLLLLTGDVTIQIIRRWILLHMNSRISISLISDFLSKLMRLPVRFFDSRSTGDLTQRINDHKRLEDFLTGTSINTVFSIINLLIFSAVLIIYNFNLFVIFFVGSILSIVWIVLFLRRRKLLDYRRFKRLQENQDSLYEIINGMQEIKLNNAELIKRWDWEKIQSKLFKVNIKGLVLEQYQEVGSSFINGSKNILITYLAAQQVISGQITLGMMLSISFIIGQMNSPLQYLITFFKEAQDAKISIDRLGEVHSKIDEEEELKNDESENLSSEDEILYTTPKIPSGDIIFDNVSFQYEGAFSPWVLKDINLRIPKGKVTAIVGSSGSGKTTLLKLILKFYKPITGNIHLDGIPFNEISAHQWRNECGTVMQDSYIFNDTITKNIVFDLNTLNEEKLLKAVQIANLEEYIDGLPIKFTSKLGSNGAGMSGGQRQRMVIARAVYKNPQYLFFDEATSALDANNESIIMKNLNDFFINKTVLIIAHRLSTVKNADQIIVLDKGQIVEVGHHSQLTEQKGYYYDLVKNQLELGE